MADTSSSEEFIEDLAIVINLLPRRVIRDRYDPFNKYDDKEFLYRYRLTKVQVMNLVDRVGVNLQPVTNRNKSISAMQQILLSLRFLATGAFQILIADDIRIHRSTACRILKKVLHHIAALINEYIEMPQNVVDVAKKKEEFQNIANFPHVIGCIDCTHIKIQSPDGDNGELYRNRKGYFSYNVQVICDSNLKIMDVVARWPESTHDTTIFNGSLIKYKFDSNAFANCFLLGDSGYAASSYMLTPVLNPQSRAEERYNAAHIRTRNCVERCFGVLKRRFPCLSMGMRLNPSTILLAISACVVLHNISIKNVATFEEEIGGNIDDVPNQIAVAPQQRGPGNAVRRAFINEHFH